MTLYSIIFYMLAGMILVSTGLAITRRNLVHAAIYLVISFFGSAMLFYLLGAPLLAALEVIIYAGAIMVLFLFIIMMLKVEGLEEHFFPMRQWIPAAGMGLIFCAVGILMISRDADLRVPLQTAVAEPWEFGQYLFQNHWLAIEIVSLLLLIAVIGVLYLGKDNGKVSGGER
ncbi:MAG: NADH-quinone oxidoreductase subunit J [Pseudomonadota bacterium]|uniref:NADH-quinone oxidoreductase subunit J n=1 Tax=Candidatus Desulfatibia profunda TaxID=2841695 RepID=A0A8J6NS69_9BACT|nr:NADH-quinone oxidoreductase subunit J [Candidatus Desulfatibia profunda]MBL7180403.1 NADH-quinone oxidoreductase subunit J [Desulfobacterales bacterium]MBU0698384.1 NADH-quinone oxidoreductase subunit J [Pseudomonadota bacterium]